MYDRIDNEPPARFGYTSNLTAWVIRVVANPSPMSSCAESINELAKICLFAELVHRSPFTRAGLHQGSLKQAMATDAIGPSRLHMHLMSCILTRPSGVHYITANVFARFCREADRIAPRIKTIWTVMRFAPEFSERPTEEDDMFHESQPDVPGASAWYTHSMPLARMTPEAVYEAWRAQWRKRLALAELGRVRRCTRASVAAKRCSQGLTTS
jgi:hypothetical protein